jgi:hypothetical protein
MKGSWREGSFSGTLKDILRLWKWASASIVAPLLGYMEWHTFLRVFEKKRNFCADFERMSKCLVNRYLCPLGPNWATWMEFVCRDLRQKRISISGFLSWTQRALRF